MSDDSDSFLSDSDCSSAQGSNLDPGHWAQKQINLHLSDEAHLRERKAAFMGNTMVIVMSHALLRSMNAIVDDLASILHASSPGTQVLVQLARAVFVSLTSVPTEWLLCRAAGKGGTYCRDALSLARDTQAWVFAWSWNSAMFALLNYLGGVFWDELVLAVGWTVLVAIWQSTACYRSGAAQVSMGGSSDTLAARYRAMPQAFTFSLACAWWNVLDFPLATWVKIPSNSPQRRAVTMALYWYIIHKVTCCLVQCFSNQSTHAAMEDEEFRRVASLGELVQDIKSVAHHWEILMVGLAGFILGNGWGDVLNQFCFGVLWECKDPASCNFGSHVVMAAVTSWGALSAVLSLEHDNAVSKQLAAYSAMMSKTLCFVASGSIIGLADVLPHVMKGGGEAVSLLERLGLAIVMWLIFAEGYHTYNLHCRLMDRRSRPWNDKKGA